MLKLIKKNQKIALAFFGVLLMLTFLVQRGDNGNGERSDRPYATVGGKPIYQSEMEYAKNEWRVLTGLVLDPPQSYAGVYYGSEVAAQFFPFLNNRVLADEFANNSDLFVLLQHEARLSGLLASPEDVNSVLAVRYNLTDKSRHVDGQGESLDPIARQAVADMLLIQMRYHQIADAVKIPRPQVQRAMATRGQTVQLNVVPMYSASYGTRVAAPTTQAVDEQFKKYAAVVPGHPNDENPLGFGYKLPVRSQVQYVRVTRLAVEQAVVASKSAYDWDFLAYKYYDAHQSEFPPAVSNNQLSVTPTVKPYAEAHDQVLAKIRGPLVDELSAKVNSFISQQLQKDWQAYKSYLTAGMNGPEPVTSLGEAFSSPVYLQRLTEQVMVKCQNVLSSFGTDSQYRSLKELGDDPNLGTSAVLKYVEQQSLEATKSPEPRPAAVKSALMQPSNPLPGPTLPSPTGGPTGPQWTLFVRVMDTLASQPPADVSVVRTAVENDLKSAEAYRLANQDAQKLLTAANTQQLAPAVLTGGFQLVVTKPLKSSDTESIDALTPPLSDEAAAKFRSEAFRLLETYDPIKNPHPATVVTLPDQRLAILIQLNQVSAPWTPADLYKAEMETAFALKQRTLSDFERNWFNFDVVSKRLDFKPIKPEKADKGSPST